MRLRPAYRCRRVLRAVRRSLAGGHFDLFDKDALMRTCCFIYKHILVLLYFVSYSKYTQETVCFLNIMLKVVGRSHQSLVEVVSLW